MRSEFGKGFSYCIGLFLMHAERYGDENDYRLWFNGAADHLYDLIIPDKLSKKLQNRIKKWQDKCLQWRLDDYTKKDKLWAIDEAKYFLRKYDENNNVKVIKGDWE